MYILAAALILSFTVAILCGTYLMLKGTLVCGFTICILSIYSLSSLRVSEKKADNDK